MTFSVSQQTTMPTTTKERSGSTHSSNDTIETHISIQPYDASPKIIGGGLAHPISHKQEQLDSPSPENGENRLIGTKV